MSFPFQHHSAAPRFSRGWQNSLLVGGSGGESTGGVYQRMRGKSQPLRFKAFQVERNTRGNERGVSVVLSKFLFKSLDLDPTQFHKIGSTPTCQLTEKLFETSFVRCFTTPAGIYSDPLLFDYKVQNDDLDKIVFLRGKREYTSSK